MINLALIKTLFSWAKVSFEKTSFQDSREQLEKVRQIKIFQYKYKPEFVSLSDEDQSKCDVARLKKLI